MKKDKLTGFGRRAKKIVLNKKNACQMATELKIHLSEHGGTGQGVVGALAGVRLRLGGNDGRFRGWYHLGRQGDSMTVRTLKSHDFIDLVRCENGELLTDEPTVSFGSEALKTVLQDGKRVLLVKRESTGSKPGHWITLTK